MSKLVTCPPSDYMNARAAEVLAALHLAWIGNVQRVPETSSPTPDFEIDSCRVEVYSPQEHEDEREVMDADLNAQLARQATRPQVAMTIGHPATGSGRRVENGEIVHDPNNAALQYPANKIIDRVLNAKRNAHQFCGSQQGVLLFENPWATIPIADRTRQQLFRLWRFRPEYSWFGPPEQLSASIDAALVRNELLAAALTGQGRVAESTD